MRRSRSIRNIITSIGSQTIVVLFGLVLPRLFITSFGSEVNGLLSSITNVFVYINLLEAGLGLASIQALYAPLANHEQNKVDSILAATARSYRRVGIYVLACVLSVALIYPLIVESSINYCTIVVLFLLQGSVTVLDYFLQAKNRILLQAEAKSYVITNINMTISIATSTCKILLIFLHFDIIAIQLSFAFISMLKILLFQRYMHKQYKHLNKNAEPDFGSISDRKYSFVHNAVFMISANIDILILTVMTNLKVVSVYAVYKIIYQGVKMIPSALQNGVNASFGQLYADNKERFTEMYASFEVMYTIITFSLFTVACILTKPFLMLYTAGVTDIEYIIYGLPIFFTASELLNEMRSLSTKVIHYAGHFKQTMKPAIIEIIINCLLSVLFVKFAGIIGVVLATVIASLYRVIAYTQYTNKYLLNRDVKITYRRWTVNSIVAACIIFLSSNIPLEIGNYFMFVVYAVVGTVIVSLMFFVGNLFIAKSELGYVVSYIKPILHNRLKARNKDVH